MIKIARMVKTCAACPSQWNGWSDSGNYYYFRYRNGTLRIDSSESKETFKVFENTIFEKELDQLCDGFLEYTNLKEITKEFIELPETEENADKFSNW